MSWMAQFVVLVSSICHPIRIWNTYFFFLPEMLRPWLRRKLLGQGKGGIWSGDGDWTLAEPPLHREENRSVEMGISGSSCKGHTRYR